MPARNCGLFFFISNNFFIFVIQNTNIMRTTDLFVCFQNGDSEVSEIYTTLAEAQKEADEINSRWYNYQKERNPKYTDAQFAEYIKMYGTHYKGMSLYDAIELIREYATEQARMEEAERNAGADY